ncbi:MULTISPECIES: ATP-binding protein [Streptosporangium]|uniref:Anti-sigma regulatory factor (Ser/Thr protein kinase) n=1 Tax=Streptosporangium brasiliense TaxID=47480 RepID=A0ABT9R9L0_9ACTN|nr:ATP-binding protein [Streptosporangium brasiliense]MDP9865935.1 anti-sigma regulatory factor (Ser/Thr protein kinase) [Streptosporangium brasiliense]
MAEAAQEGVRAAPEGTQAAEEGPRAAADGAQVTLDGARATADGAQVALDGARAASDGVHMTLDGAQVAPDGARAAADGKVSFPIVGDLAGLRRLARRFLEPEAFDELREMNFILAISEAANNVLDHAGTAGTVTLLRAADRIVAEISDRAGLLTDAEAGTTAPPVGSRRGYGLWLMRQMCDKVEILHGPAGSTVRLTVLRA